MSRSIASPLPLSAFQADLILSIFSPRASLLSARAFQPEYLPGPLKVEVMAPGNRSEAVVLRLARHHQVPLEAQVFELLSRLGLAVPRVLAGPVTDPAAPELGPMAVRSLLPGESLQQWSQTSAAGLDLALSLAVEAITRLHQLTEAVRQAPLARLNA